MVLRLLLLLWGGCPWCYDCYGVAARGVGGRIVKSAGKVDKAYRGNHYKNNDARRDTSWVRWKVFPSRGLSATAPAKNVDNVAIAE